MGVNLLLVLNRSLLNKEYNPINALYALVATVSMCSLHVIVLSKITSRYFTLFTNGKICPFNVIRDSGGLIQWEKQTVIEFSTNWSFLRTLPSLRSVAYRLVSSAKRARFQVQIQVIFATDGLSASVLVSGPRFLVLLDICSLRDERRPP
jgi:hypothetical protein